jgi:hypothetical protein
LVKTICFNKIANTCTYKAEIDNKFAVGKILGNKENNITFKLTYKNGEKDFIILDQGYINYWEKQIKYLVINLGEITKENNSKIIYASDPDFVHTNLYVRMKNKNSDCILKNDKSPDYYENCQSTSW